MPTQIPGGLRADPTMMRIARPIGGALAEGATLTNAVEVSEYVPVAGAARIRVHWKSTVAGSLAIHFCRPDRLPNPARYTAGNPTAVPIVANTENVIDVATHFGEHMMEVAFTPSATGALTYADVSTT